MATYRNWLLYVFPMALVAAAPAAKAQDDSVVIMPTMTVTATSNPMSAFEYPGSVSVVGPQEMTEKIPSDLSDIFEGIPNVTFAGGPRRTGQVPIIRGFTGQDVIIRLDGMRQDFLSGHDGRFFIDPALLESVEVVRGANSALYGSGGLGGVIEFRTKSASDFLAPGQTYGANIFMSAQSVNDEIAPGITLFAAPIEGLDLIGSFVYRDSGDIKLGGGGTLKSDDDIKSGLAKASYNFGPHTIEGAWTRYGGWSNEPNNGQSADSENYVDKHVVNDNYRLTYSYNDVSNTWIDLDATFYYNRTKTDELTLNDLSGSLYPANTQLNRNLDTYGMRIDNRSRFSLGEDAPLVVTYGVEAYREVQKGTADGADYDGVYNGVPDASANFAGVFIQGELTLPAPLGIPGNFLIIPGLRYDYYKSESDIADSNKDDYVSPKIAVSYLPTDWLMIYGSYAHAFSAPTMNDLYATGVHFQIPPLSPGWPTTTNYFIPNPGLKPQTTQTFEVGMGITFDNIFWRHDSFTAKGGYFHTYAENLISFDVNQPTFFVDCLPMVPGSCNGTTTVVNIANAKLQGFELEAAYDNEYFLTELSYGQINGTDLDTGGPIGSLQPASLTLHVAGKLQQIDTQIGWRVTWADDFVGATSSEDRDGYIVQDVYAVWYPRQEFLRGLSVAVGIDNVTNEAYSLVYTGANEPGRNFKGLVSYTIAW